MATKQPPAGKAEIVTVEKKALTIEQLVASNERQITSLLPKHLNPRHLMRLVVTAINGNKDLVKCTGASLVRATLQAAMMGLPPNDGRGLAYLIPFKRRAQIDGRWTDVHEVQLIPGYRGLLLLARQSGEVKSVGAHEVREGDFFEYEEGTSQILRYRESTQPAYVIDGDGKERREVEKRPITHAWFMADVDGEKQITVLPWWKIERIRNRSQGYQVALHAASEYNKAPTGPWFEHPGPMAAKTAVRAGCKLLPLSSDRFLAAQTLDEQADRGEAQIFDPRVVDSVADPDEERTEQITDAGGMAAARQKRLGDAPPEKCDGKHDGDDCGAADCYRTRA